MHQNTTFLQTITNVLECSVEGTCSNNMQAVICANEYAISQVHIDIVVQLFTIENVSYNTKYL